MPPTDKTCPVCGPPVKEWWPVHFALCSNQNALVNEDVTLVRTSPKRRLDEVLSAYQKNTES